MRPRALSFASLSLSVLLLSASAVAIVHAASRASAVSARARASAGGGGPSLPALETSATVLSPTAAVAADFDGDGLPDVAAGFFDGRGGSLVLYRSTRLRPSLGSDRNDIGLDLDAALPGHTFDNQSVIPPATTTDRVPAALAGVIEDRNAPELSETGPSPAAPPRRDAPELSDASTPPAAPPLREAVSISIPERPDHLVAGDFNADGHADLVAAATGGRAVWFLAGDGRGGFTAPLRMTLPGAVTALTAGDINRADGLSDLVIGLEEAGRASLALYESPHGAVLAVPVSLDLPSPARALAIGAFSGDCAKDLAVAAGRELLLIRGEDRHLASGGAASAWRPAVSRLEIPADALSIVPLPFSAPGSALDGLAVLTPNQILLVAVTEAVSSSENPSLPGPRVSTGGLNPESARAVRREPAAVTGGVVQEGLSISRIIDAAPTLPEGSRWLVSSDDRVTGRREASNRGAGAPQLITAAHPGGGAQLMISPGLDGRWSFSTVGPETGETMAQPRDLPALEGAQVVLPVRMNDDSQPDLVVFREGSTEPVVLLTAPTATFTVTSTADTDDGLCDSADCTLREAITAANTSPGSDAIEFNVGVGTPSIALASALPDITDPATIRGDTGGATRVELNGEGAGSGANGLMLAAGSGGSLVRALVINRFGGLGIRIESAGNIVGACYVGTDSDGGGTVSGNAAGGILLTGAAARNTLIGGATMASRNVISHSAFGVMIDAGASQNQVQGNFIGPDASGIVTAGNGDDGVLIRGSQSNTVGGPAAVPGFPPGNVISGNTADGIDIRGSGSDGNLVSGNLIGTDASGTSALPNAQNGVFVEGGAKSNTIGGTSDAQRNVISAGSTPYADGVEISEAGTDQNTVSGNFIGTDITGNAALGNAEYGILVQAGAQNTVIGAVSPIPGRSGGNVISGNAFDGVRITYSTSQGTHLLGNLIGLNASGEAALANGGSGVVMAGAVLTTIGGDTTDSRNVISGNGLHGIEISGAGAQHNEVAGNFIGLGASGAASVPNGGSGVRIFAPSNGWYNEIGGETSLTGTPPGNVISGNGQNGIVLSGFGVNYSEVYGNLIGLDATGSYAVANRGNGVLYTNSAHNAVLGGPSNDATPDSDGLEINGPGTYEIWVAWNWIGTNRAGTAAVPNGGNGVLITNRANGNYIGYTPYGGGTGNGPNVISGNDANDGSDGVELNGQGVIHNYVISNTIGLAPDGRTPMPNRNNGILITNGASTNLIGGGTGLGGNVISGNNLTSTSDGIEINGSSNNFIQDNLIGTDASGLTAVGNGGDGVFITDAPFNASANGNTVGGTSYDRNVISGNHGDGVEIMGSLARSNLVQANYIGLSSNGSYGLGNGAYGVFLIAGAGGNIIGGTSGLTPSACTGPCNRIGSNALAGVAVDTTASTANLIRGNTIVRNGGLGIDLLPTGPTSNDPMDSDTGPNRLQNFPAITGMSYAGGTTTIQGTLDSAPSVSYTVDLFGNPSGDDPSGYGQGEVYLGSTTCSTDAGGHCAWTLSAAGLQPSPSATATDPSNNTSEFSIALSDRDGDGHLDALDCAPLDASAFALSSEVAGQSFSANKLTQTWTSAAPSAGPGLVHDLMRGQLGQWPVGVGGGETCIAPGTAGTSADDPARPAAGSGFYYLVRGRNACGAGSYGTASSGAPRITSACP